ncbi:MAG TPA: alpha/beta hydrolase [Dehalococcoidia bacterium]|nr:alpha/beta hydrolase [Dehalococcoidia bacterium]
MPTLEVNGAAIYYEVHGRGPWLVFAHGAGGNHLSWWQQVPAFARRYRCLVFDHRGFGLSRQDDRPPDPTHFVDDLESLLEHLEVDEVRLVAQSMGGLTCLGYALRHPQRVRALVMANTLVGMRRAVWAAADARVRHLAQRLWEQRRSRLPRRALSLRFVRSRPHLAFLYREIAALNGPRPEDLPRRYPVLDPSGEAIRSLPVPVLLIVGEEDDLFPPALVEVAARLLPNARLLVVPGAGHSVYFEQPEVFNRAVLEFLDEVG